MLRGVACSIRDVADARFVTVEGVRVVDEIVGVRPALYACGVLATDNGGDCLVYVGVEERATEATGALRCTLADGATVRELYDGERLETDDENDRPVVNGAEYRLDEDENDDLDPNEPVEVTLPGKLDRPNDGEKDGLERIADAPLRKPPQSRWKEEPRGNEPPLNPDERPSRYAAPAASVIRPRAVMAAPTQARHACFRHFMVHLPHLC